MIAVSAPEALSDWLESVLLFLLLLPLSPRPLSSGDLSGA